MIYAHLPPFERLEPKQQSPSDERGQLKETQPIAHSEISPCAHRYELMQSGMPPSALEWIRRPWS